jgi:DNA-binding Lrp family transcriptional regulator
MPKRSVEQINADDMKILAVLQKNSNDSIDTTAKKCGFSRQKVWRAIKQLEKSHLIWGYTVITDEQKKNRQTFILLLKRSMHPIDQRTADGIALTKFEKEYNNMGIMIESSYYVHGDFDWVIIFTAADLKQAKKFSGLLFEKYPGIVGETRLLQTLYAQRQHHILNPDPMALREFL